ncbi:hypothetical protein D3C75_969080 [compost metagenome]
MSLKELGLSLEEIKTVLTGNDFSLPEIISLQIARIKANMRVQQKLLRELEHISSLMQSEQSLTIEDFTKVLETMRMSHEKFFADKRKSWNQHLDRLGDFLDEHPE